MRPWTRAAAALLCLWTLPSEAHKPSDSYLTVSQPAKGTSLEGQWDIALRDLNHAIGLDANADGLITWGELKARQDGIAQYAFTHLQLEAMARGDRGNCRVHLRQLLFDEHVDGGYAVLRFGASCPFRAAQLAVHYSLLFALDPNHRGLLEVRAGRANQAQVVSEASPSVTLNLGSPARWRQFLAFVNEGMWHIWKGYDHILFLLTLLLPAVVIRVNGVWRARESMRDAALDVLKVVTAFTLAHSLTLTLAVNGLVNLPSRWVESGIALTVLLGALNNLFPIVRQRRWAVAFAFGLIHGLGFASVLADLGLRSWDLVIALVGFNGGVEAGQLALVLVFVPLAYVLRETRFYRMTFMPIGAALIGVIAAYWLTIRLTGVSLQ
ncbi:MAG: HupE/UreJ family protein [Steroidobacteraceae bacterium]